MNYTLIFEDKQGQSESIDIVGILQVFNQVKLNLHRIKNNDLKITLIKNDGNLSEYFKT